MLKRILFFVFFISCFESHSQSLVYKSNGNIIDTEKKAISPDKMRLLLANNEKMLKEYNAGRSKKTVGNIMFYGGLGFVAGDLLREAFTTKSSYGYKEERTYPSALTYIGVASFLVSIPVKIGFSKKIKNVVADYNKQNSIGSNQPNYKEIDFITNSNGIGFRLSLN